MPAASSSTQEISAWRGRTAPEASGRPAVRATLPVHVAVPHVVDHAAGGAHHHGADRESAISRSAPAGARRASRIHHSPGRNSSHAPIGRSSRASST